MAYNWNKMETITVPVGLNGWLYSGQITINGVTTKFPVGVETSLPEPVAAMIKQMIAVEEGDKVAKPDNSYVGNVTIPEGKVLRLEKGAMVEDEAGVLGTASGGASTVVVLEETTLTGEGELALGTPFNVQPEAGKTYKVTYNGAPYDCPGVETDLGGGIMGVLLGNAELAGGSGGNTEAPFTIVVVPPAFVDQMGAYAAIYDTSGATSVTLSITQEGAASGSIPTTTEPNMQLVTDENGNMMWESRNPVVLQETTFTGEGGQFVLKTPFKQSLVAGNMYDVTYNGTVYECPAVEVTQDVAAVCLGNLSPMGVAGGNDNAPFIIVESPPESANEENGYAMIMDLDGATSATISIVDMGETDGGVKDLTVFVQANLVNGIQIKFISHTLDAILLAARAGHIVRMLFSTSDTIPTIETGGMILPLTAYQDDMAIFCAKVMYNTTYEVTVTADGASGSVGT